jgi:hypothetical protein
VNLLRLERTIFWIVPAAVLVVAFAGVCILAGSPWPWNEVVHEDGHRTLLSTVFYMEHASRELLPDVVLALAVAGAVRHYFPPIVLVGRGDAARSHNRLGLLCLMTLLAIAGGTVVTEGVQSFIDNLAQMHTREGAPLVWGAHWRYHLIERFAQIMLAFSVSGLVWLLHGRPRTAPAGRPGWFGVALVAFIVATIVFRLTPEPFRDPMFLGHQLRELFTHALVTLPLALGVCLSLVRKHSSPEPRPANLQPQSVWPIAVTGVLAILSGAYLLVTSLVTDAQSQGQASGLARLLLPHFFEHALGYVLVPTLAGWLYLTPFSIGVRTPRSRLLQATPERHE